MPKKVKLYQFDGDQIQQAEKEIEQFVNDGWNIISTAGAGSTDTYSSPRQQGIIGSGGTYSNQIFKYLIVLEKIED